MITDGDEIGVLDFVASSMAVFLVVCFVYFCLIIA